MTIRIRSSSHEHLVQQEAFEQTLSPSSEKELVLPSLDPSTPPSHSVLKKICARSFSHDPLPQNLIQALINDPRASVKELRKLSREQWMNAIQQGMCNDILMFNLARSLIHLNDRLIEKTAQTFNSVESMTQKELYLKAIELNPQNSLAYEYLAHALMQEMYGHAGSCKEYFLSSSDLALQNQLYLKLIHLNPENDKNYVLLGKLCQLITAFNLKDSYIPIFPEIIYDEAGLYHQALLLNSHNDEAYTGLGILEDQKEKDNSLSSKNFYLKALECNLHNLEAAMRLYDKGDEFTLVRQTAYTPLQLVIEALQSNPESLLSTPHWDFFLNIKSEQRQVGYFFSLLRFFVNSSLKKEAKRCFIKRIIQVLQAGEVDFDAQEGILYCFSLLTHPHLLDIHEDLKLLEKSYTIISQKIGYILPPLLSQMIDLIKTYLPHEREKLKYISNSLIVALHSQDENYEGYYDVIYDALAKPLTDDETVTILGQVISRKELILRAVENAYSSYFYSSYEYLQESAAQSLSRFAFTLKEEDLPRLTLMFYNPNLDYSLEQSIQQDAPLVLTKESAIKRIYEKAVFIAPMSPWPYFYSGKRFQHPINLQEVSYSSSQDLFLEAIKIDPNHIESYIALARRSLYPLTINNTLYSSAKDLLIKIIDLYPSYAKGYYLLAKQLSSEDTVTLLSQKIVTRHQLYLRSIQLGIQKPHPYFQLAKDFKENQAVLLCDQKTVLRPVDLFFQAFSLNPTSELYLQKIALYFKKQQDQKKKLASHQMSIY
ncbi:MAG: hypothetical protein QRY72_01005 [Candidatus Rhabdochlamydia sp.]